MTTENLPDDDRDLILARELADGGEPQRESGFLAFLRRGRGLRLARVEEAPSDRIWAVVERHTRPTPRVYSLSSRRIFAVAAVLAVIAVSAVLLRMLRADVQALLVADAGTPAVYTADDGSTITLRPNSALFVHERTGVFELSGEGYFAVAPQTGNVFSVRTRDAVVSVLGTRFFVSDWSGGTEVFLEEGSVQITARQGDATETIRPGDRRLVAGTEIVSLDRGGLEQSADWLAGELVFRSTAFNDVAQEIAFHFGVSVELTEGVGSDTISGTLILDTPAGALADLAALYGGSFEERNGAFVFVPATR